MHDVESLQKGELARQVSHAEALDFECVSAFQGPEAPEDSDCRVSLMLATCGPKQAAAAPGVMVLRAWCCKQQTVSLLAATSSSH